MKRSVKNIIDNYSSMSIEHLMSEVDKYNYISFDIFDTLLKRDVEKPADVFSIMEKSLGIDGFYDMRVKAEQKARYKKRDKSGEVTIEDIYNNLDVAGFDAEELISEEKRFEFLLSTKNIEMFEVYQKCLKSKKVILISDMYLDRKTIEGLLEKNGFVGYGKLYISNELNIAKSGGELYKYVLSDMKISAKNILHIGNSFRADYINAKKCGIASCKLSTYTRRLQREYSSKRLTFSNKTLNAFLNNHVRTNDTYFQFGYEVFGPLLYGFVEWVYTSAKEQGLEQILFLSRDGYIMKRAYDLLGFNREISSLYLEVSRRSLRVPRLSKKNNFADVFANLFLPNMTNMVQIFDSLGLDANDYSKQIKINGFDFSSPLKRDELVQNQKMESLYNEIRGDVESNATIEYKNLVDYLKQFDFAKKTAIVDIGWAGSMQKDLVETLSEIPIEHNIYGYYVGLTKKALVTLSEYKGRARGYAFDCFNRQDSEMESAYIGLIESMFLERDGSVKKYVIGENGIIAERYPYEYRTTDGELMRDAVIVHHIQEGAITFASDFDNSILSNVLTNHADIMYSYLHEVGSNPKLINIKQFGAMRFFNCGYQVYLAKPQGLMHYMINIKELKRDIYDSQWKIGFMKALFKLNLPYEKIFKTLRRKANR